MSCCIPENRVIFRFFHNYHCSREKAASPIPRRQTGIARIAHQLSTAGPRCRMSIALHLNNTAQYLLSMLPRVLLRAPCIHTTSRALVAKPGEQRLLSILVIISPLLFFACTTPALHIQEKAGELGFKQIRLSGAGFQHLAFRNDRYSADGSLHVYIESDGSPWLSANVVSTDPTPRNPLMLRLMAEDPTSSIYLGRPCYLGWYRRRTAVGILSPR